MTSYADKRCAHCGTVYSFQASGYGCMDDHNNARYCRECAKEVDEALAAVFSRIPVRFKKVWVETKDIDIETLLEHERKLDEETMRKGRIFGRRVDLPLWDAYDLSNSMDAFYVSYRNRDYRIERWTKTPERDKIEIAMEKNLETGELKPWRML